MPSVLITGANRGMGVEHARQYAEDNWRVFACCRNPAVATELNDIAQTHENLTVHPLDLTDQNSIEALKSKLTGQPIDVLLNNASHLGNLDQQRLGDKDYDTHEKSFAVNALGPFRMAEAFLDNVRASAQKKDDVRDLQGRLYRVPSAAGHAIRLLPGKGRAEHVCAGPAPEPGAGRHHSGVAGTGCGGHTRLR